MCFLHRLASFILLSVAAAAAQTPAAPPRKLPFELKLIAPNIWAAIDDASGDAGANAGFVIGDSGVAVMDTFEDQAAATLLAQIQTTTHLPINFVVNTHYHIDHVAGNRVFSNAGAVIVVHRNVAAWVNSENPKFFGDKIKPEEQAFIEDLLGPEVAYDSELSLFLGTRRVDVKFLSGHTGGDSIVSIPDAGVVFCGDLFWRKTLPNLTDATTRSWLRTLGEISVIPSPGTANDATAHAGDASDAQNFQKYLEFLRAATQKAEKRETLSSPWCCHNSRRLTVRAIFSRISRAPIFLMSRRNSKAIASSSSRQEMRSYAGYVSSMRA